MLNAQFFFARRALCSKFQLIKGKSMQIFMKILTTSTILLLFLGCAGKKLIGEASINQADVINEYVQYLKSKNEYTVKDEEKLYRLADKQRNAYGYNMYLKCFPNSTLRLYNIEKSYWIATKLEDQIFQYDLFLKYFANSTFTNEAKQMKLLRVNKLLDDNFKGLKREISLGKNFSIKSIFFSPDGKYFAIHGKSYNTNKTVIIWYILSGEEIDSYKTIEQAKEKYSFQFNKRNNTVNTKGKKYCSDSTTICCISKNIKYIISVDSGRNIKVYDIIEDKLIKQLSVDERITALDISPNNKLIALTFSNGFINLWTAPWILNKEVIEAKKIDKQLYEIAKKNDTKKGYRDYITSIPNGKFLKEANELTFMLYKKQNTINGFKDFIKDFPMTSYKNEAIKIVFELYKKQNTIDGYNEFIDKNNFFPQRSKAIELIYNLYQEQDTIEGYKKFIKKHPYATEFLRKSHQRIELLKWNNIETKNTIEGLREYIQQNPNGNFVIEAKKRIDDLTWNKIKSKNNISDFNDYISQFQNGKYTQKAKDKIENLTWKKYKAKNSVQGYNEYIKKYPKGKYIKKAKQKRDSSIPRLTTDAFIDKILIPAYLLLKKIKKLEAKFDEGVFRGEFETKRDYLKREKNELKAQRVNINKKKQLLESYKTSYFLYGFKIYIGDYDIDRQLIERIVCTFPGDEDEKTRKKIYITYFDTPLKSGSYFRKKNCSFTRKVNNIFRQIYFQNERYFVQMFIQGQLYDNAEITIYDISVNTNTAKSWKKDIFSAPPNITVKVRFVGFDDPYTIRNWKRPRYPYANIDIESIEIR